MGEEILSEQEAGFVEEDTVTCVYENRELLCRAIVKAESWNCGPQLFGEARASSWETKRHDMIQRGCSILIGQVCAFEAGSLENRPFSHLVPP
jgi:hypothetical protein